MSKSVQNLVMRKSSKIMSKSVQNLVMRKSSKIMSNHANSCKTSWSLEAERTVSGLGRHFPKERRSLGWRREDPSFHNDPSLQEAIRSVSDLGIKVF